MTRSTGIVDNDLLREIRYCVRRCEWIETGGRGQCRRNGVYHVLHAHHIFGRGMGGGKRDDSPHVIAVLCMEHHDRAHQAGFWNRTGQELLQSVVLMHRPLSVWKDIFDYMAERGLPVTAPELIQLQRQLMS